MLNCLDVHENAEQLGNFYPISLGFHKRSIALDVDHTVKKLLELSKSVGESGIYLIGHSRERLIALLSAQRLINDFGIDVRGIVAFGSPINGSPWASRGDRYLKFLHLHFTNDLTQ